MRARPALEVCTAVAARFECDWVELFADTDRLEELRAEVEPLTAPDFEGIVASGVETLGIPERGAGVVGVLDIFREWLEGFRRYEVKRFEFRELPDGRFLSAAPIEAEMADPAMKIGLEIGTLWRVEDGLLARLEFFMTVAEAEEAASGSA